jgi:hypothetical protein
MPCSHVLTMLYMSLLVVACGGDGDEARAGGPQPAPCATEELTLPDGSCRAAGLPPNMVCPPGARALEDGSCQPAGVPAEACAAGRFRPDGRGGCEAILPEEPCPFGQMAVPGESACREVSPCGEGPWGPTPVEATTQYVDQGYSGDDSDGSRTRPWRTVQAGVNAAAAGALVAVAEGRYVEDIFIRNKAVRLWGRCPARTVVAGRGMQQGAITVVGESASGSEVRGLGVTGPRGGVLLRRVRRVVLDALWIHDTGFVGVYATAGVSVSLRGALVERNSLVGLLALGAEASVEVSVVRATRPDGAGKLGRGIDVEDLVETGAPGQLSLTASLIEQNYDNAVFLSGSEARIEATVVRATRGDGAGTTGVGIVVAMDSARERKSKLLLTTSLIDQNRSVGVFVEGSEATVDATVVRETQGDGRGIPGRGIVLNADPVTGGGAKLSLSASLVEQNEEVGVLVTGSEATIDATVVRETRSDRGILARGIIAQENLDTGEGAKLSLSASLVEQNQGGGLILSSSDATVDATVVRGNQPDSTGANGWGIGVQASLLTGRGATLSLTASLVEQNHAVGMLVAGSEAKVEGTVVRATQPVGAGVYGYGISVQPNPYTAKQGQLSLTTSLIEENHAFGVFVYGSEATVATTVIRGTKPAPLRADFGDGILLLEKDLSPSHAVFADTAALDNARSGLIFVGSSGELNGVWSSGNQFGLVLQPGSTSAQPELVEGNVFEGNTKSDKLERGDLAVPDAPLPLP